MRMVRTVRAWRRATGLIALVAMLVATFGSVVHTAGDADCAITVLHDASAHRFTAPDDAGNAQPPLHCLACHWSRTFRPRTETVYFATLAVEASTAIPIEPTSPVSASVAAQPPLRSPPL
jgi:hypothetical protein